MLQVILEIYLFYQKIEILTITTQLMHQLLL
ncbi:Uncharacterised protein [Chlamydia trachomatis]|nr:Uncharacterised protein [Chlamydia trachomatis]